ncbi:alpha-D-ribose 1-methylphosphonate 5-triphosphate diphosphatase [Bradyrhizobium sp. USDA 4369]
MSTRLVNARIVREDRVVEGDLTILGSVIKDVGEAPDVATHVLDCEGDFLVPGLIDVHTDDVEHYVQPRPGVRWPSMLAAVLAHDWQLLGSGITTVLDALSLGDADSGGVRTAMLDAAIDGLSHARSEGLLKADHYLHLRCELSDPVLLPIVERHMNNPGLRLVSLMDHTPGQRQWHDLKLFREFRRKRNARVWTDDEFSLYLAERRDRQRRHVPPSRTRIGQLCQERCIPTASHDDTTVADVDESHAHGITISEFPTTVAAARRARQLGMKIAMGSPNVILGRSHSGNVSALELAEEGLLDILTSDYVPGSLLHAAFALAERGFDLARTVAMVTANPANLLGFVDRGRIAAGLRADLLRVRVIEGVPVIRNIWVVGRQFL